MAKYSIMKFGAYFKDFNCISYSIKMSLFFRIDILPETIKPYNADDANQFKQIVVFDCRGYQPVEFKPLVIESIKAFLFHRINLSSGFFQGWMVG